MTLRRIAFKAKECHPSGQFAGQITNEFLLSPEILAKVSEVSFEVAISSQPMTNIARSTQRAFVSIDNTDGLECRGKRRLREAFAPRDGELSNIEQCRDLRGSERREESIQAHAFVTDRIQMLELHRRSLLLDARDYSLCVGGEANGVAEIGKGRLDRPFLCGVLGVPRRVSRDFHAPHAALVEPSTQSWLPLTLTLSRKRERECGFSEGLRPFLREYHSQIVSPPRGQAITCAGCPRSETLSWHRRFFTDVRSKTFARFRARYARLSGLRFGSCESLRMKKTSRVTTRTARELARALALAPEDAIEIDVRSLLVDKIASAVAERELTHSEAAKLAATSRSRMTAILNRNTQDVSTDLLLRILGRLGYRTRVTITRSPSP